MRRIFPLAAAIAALGLASPTARAQSGRERPAVDRGVGFLKSQVARLDPGVAGLTALALNKSGLPADDPAIGTCLARIAPTFSGTVESPTYTPALRGGPDLYEASVVLISLVSIDFIAYKPQINACAQYLISKQNANGSWDYADRSAGDESMSQYALLALWEAENVGIVVPPSVWDKAASYYLSVQGGAGGWTYHRDAPVQPDTLSMTAAGVGSLLICQKQLARHRKGQDLINPLMIPLGIDGKEIESRYKVETSAAAINSGINRGLAWLSSNYQVNKNPIVGQSPYYALYGIERLASSTARKTPSGARGTGTTRGSPT